MRKVLQTLGCILVCAALLCGGILEWGGCVVGADGKLQLFTMPLIPPTLYGLLVMLGLYWSGSRFKKFGLAESLLSVILSIVFTFVFRNLFWTGHYLKDTVMLSTAHWALFGLGCVGTVLSLIQHERIKKPSTPQSVCIVLVQLSIVLACVLHYCAKKIDANENSVLFWSVLILAILLQFATGYGLSMFLSPAARTPRIFLIIASLLTLVAQLYTLFPGAPWCSTVTQYTAPSILYIGLPFGTLLTNLKKETA